MELQLKTVFHTAAFNFCYLLFNHELQSMRKEFIRTKFNKCAIHKDADIVVIPSQPDASAACQMPEVHSMSSAAVC